MQYCQQRECQWLNGDVNQVLLLLLCCAAADVRDLVAVYKNPPYPIFYDVVYHSYALVPMLASKLYYSSKFSSTVLTSFITGGYQPVRCSCSLGSWGVCQKPDLQRVAA
jgi:hypothetical protein